MCPRSSTGQSVGLRSQRLQVRVLPGIMTCSGAGANILGVSAQFAPAGTRLGIPAVLPAFR